MTSRPVRARRRVIEMVVLVVGALMTLLAVQSGSSPALAQTVQLWPDDAVAAAAIVLVEGESPQVVLTWPEPAEPGGVDRIEVWRGDSRSATLGATATTWTDVDPITVTNGWYQVRAYTPGGEFDVLPGILVAIPDPARGCTISFTGTASDAWEDLRNWAPVVTDRDSLPDPRVPGRDDLVCIDLHEVGRDDVLNLPVVVTTTEGVGAVDSAATPLRETIDVRSGTLAVAGGFDVRRLVVSGGALSLPAGGTIGNGAGNRPSLVLDGGSLQLGGPLIIGGEVSPSFRVAEVVATADTTIGGAGIEAGTLSVEEGSSLTGDGTTLQVVDAVFRDGGTLANGATPSTLRVDDIEVDAGGAAIQWTVEASGPGGFGDIEVATGAGLRLADMAALSPGDGQLEQWFLGVAGELTFAEPVSGLGVVQLFDGGTILQGGGGVPFQGITAVEDLYLSGSATFPGDLSADVIALEDLATLVVQGTLTPGFLTMRDGSLLQVDEPLVIPDTAAPHLLGQVTIVGDVVLQGDLYLDPVFDEGAGVVNRHLTIEGILVIDPGGILHVRAGEGGLSTGELRLEGGQVSADVGDLAVNEVVRVVETRTPPQGRPEDVVVTGESVPAGTRVELRDDGIYVIAGDGGDDGECMATPPVVLGLVLQGCWADRGNGTYVAGIGVAPDGALPGIGGLVIDPSADAILVLDLSDPTSPQLHSVLSADETSAGSASVTIPLSLPGAGAGALQADGDAAIDLGTIEVAWDLAQRIDLPAIADLLGIPLPVGSFPGLEVVDGAWVMDLLLDLPDLLGDLPVGIDLPIGLDGISADDLVFDDIQGLVLGEIATLEDVVLSWAEGTAWDIASAIEDQFNIDGQLDYDGGLDAGTLTVSGLTIAGMGDPDASVVLAFDRAAEQWAGSYDDGGQQVAVSFTTAGGALIAADVGLAGVDTGLGQIDLRLTKAEARWSVDGTVTHLGGTTALTGVVELADGGGLQQLILTAEGSFGPFGQLSPLTLQYDADPDGADIPQTAGYYALTATVQSAGAPTAVSGHLVVDQQGLFEADVELVASLGELAGIDGRLEYGRERDEWELRGRDDEPSATLSCAGGDSAISGALQLRGGTPVAGQLHAEGLCLGLAALEEVELVVATDDATGTAWDLTAGIHQPEGDTETITGRLAMVGGVLQDGSLSVPALSIEGMVEIPAFQLRMERRDGEERWRYATEDRDLVVRSVELAFADGTLTLADVRLGSVDGATTGPVASWGEWLVLRSLRLSFPGDGGSDLDAWKVDGTTSGGALSGSLIVRGGSVDGGSLTLDDVEVGPLATMDLVLTVEGDRGFAVAGTVQGEAFEDDPSVSGHMTFADGGLESASVVLSVLPLGELATIEDFALGFEEGGAWTLAGSVTGGEVANAFAGSAAFDDGRLLDLSLSLDHLSLGVGAIEDLQLQLAREPSDPNTTGTYLVSGVVIGPAAIDDRGNGGVTEEPVTGSLTMAGGVVTDMAIAVPHLQFGGLAYLTDLSLGYVTDDTGAATVSGAAQLTTAADTAPSAAALTVTLLDGVVTQASVTADDLSLGGMFTISDLQAQTVLGGDPTECPGDGGRGARLWQVSGQVGQDDTPLDGCLVIADGALVGAALDLGTVVLGEVVTLADTSVTYTGREQVEVPVLGDDGEPTTETRALTLTTLRLAASIITDDPDAPASVTGEVQVMDGGLRSLDLGIGELPLLGGMTVESAALTYEQAMRWDGVSDTTFALSGTVRHDQTTTSLGGAFTFAPTAAGGQLTAAAIDIADLPLGPVTVDRFSLTHVQGQDLTSWGIEGEVTHPTDDRVVEISGQATLDDATVTEANLRIPRFSVGELLELSDLQLTYSTGSGRTTWAGAGTVGGLPDAGGTPSSASLTISLDDDGRLVDGLITAQSLRWAGVFELQSLRLQVVRTGDVVRWDLDAEVAVGQGDPGGATGNLVLRDGIAESGSILITDVGLGGLATIVELQLSTTPTPDGRYWTGTSVIDTGDTRVTQGSATMRWEGGRLVEGELLLGNIPFTESITLEALALEFPSADGAQRRWAASASVSHEQGTSTLGGNLVFTEGQITGGRLMMDGVPLGPLQLESFDLVYNGGAGQICGVTPQQTGDIFFSVDATVAYGDGSTSSLGGYVDMLGGRVQSGAVCGSGIQITELAMLDDVSLTYASPSPTRPYESWSGAVSVRNAGRANAQASLAFTTDAAGLRSLNLSANGIDLGKVLELRQVLISFDRSANGASWVVGATLAKPGGNGSTVAGTLQVQEGVIVGGSLVIDHLPFGDMFTLDNVSITYVGRRANRTLPQEASGGFQLTEYNGCGNIPSGFNVPTGTPTTAGAESYFTVSGGVTVNNSTYFARGSLGFDDGKVSSFDVTLDCLPFGDMLRLEDVRVALNQQGSFRMGGRMGIDSRPDAQFYAAMNFDNGRMTGGELRFGGVPLGITTIESMQIALGQNANGSTTWAAGLSLESNGGDVYGGSASLTMQDGTITAGSITIDELPILDLVTVTDLSLSLDQSTTQLQVAGSGGVRKPGSSQSSSLAFSTAFDEGRLIAGSLAANNLTFFETIPIQSFSLSFHQQAGWNGAITTFLDGVPGAPTIAMGIEVEDGRLVGGQFGFDGDGDLEADEPGPNGAAPQSGGGQMSVFPLRALYVSFCPDGSTADYCDGEGNTWKGRIAVELPMPPTGGSRPGIDGSITIRNGKLVAAALEVSGLNVPIFTGTVLTSIGARIENDPRLTVGGDLGARVGPAAAPIVALTGGLEFNEMPVWDPNEVAYEDYSAEFLQFVIHANAQIFGMPVNAGGYLDIQTRGYFGIGGYIVFEPVSFLSLSAQVDGSVFDQAGIGATHPKTGDPLTGPGFQVGARLRVTLLGWTADGELLVNNIGLGVCAGIDTHKGRKSIGLGFYWDNLPWVNFQCNMAKYTIAEAVSDQALQAVLGFSSAEQEARFGQVLQPPVEEATHFFTVGAGEALLGVEMHSEEGQPAYALVHQDGTRYEAVDSDPTDDGVLLSRADNQQHIIIADPAPGMYSLVPLEGSVEPSEISIAGELPDASVTGTVSPEGDGFAIDYDIAELEGQEVIFFERAVDPDDVFEAPIGGAEDLSGRMVFTPAGSGGTSQRQVVAMVRQDGMPRAEIPVGDVYTVPEAQPASAPQALEVVEVDGGAYVRWQAPASTGGREILGYRITSDAGMGVDTMADTLETVLPIPAMTVGEEVPVYVQAITGVGNGEAAVGTFTSTQETGMVYGAGVPDDGPREVVTERLAGGSRIETAVAVSQARFAPGVDAVYIATGDDFPDALTGGPSASADGAPVLLTSDPLPVVVVQEIQRLDPDRIVILGGTAVISEEVEAQLAGLADRVDRLAGSDRFATAAAISQALAPDGADAVYLATGRDFPDALSGGVAAAIRGVPVLLSEGDRVPDVIAAELQRLAPDQVVLLGGEAALTAAVEEAVRALLPDADVQRRAGASRFETASAVAADLPPGASAVYLATGDAFPDALAGVPAAAAEGAPLLLTGAELPDTTLQAMRRADPGRVVILGGTARIPESLVDDLVARLGAG